MLSYFASVGADLVYSSTTEGFWISANSLPSKPRLVYGDEQQFKRDCRKAANRSVRRIERYEKNRWLLAAPELWCEWWFHPEIWDV